MIINGFMHKIHYKSRYLHVETEYYGGQEKKQIVTIIYEGGAVLDKITYPPETEEAEACRQQMAGQHKQALRNILAGRYDPVTEWTPPREAPCGENLLLEKDTDLPQAAEGPSFDSASGPEMIPGPAREKVLPEGAREWLNEPEVNRTPEEISSPAAMEGPQGETSQEQEDTKPIGDAVSRARYKLRELSSLPGFVGLHIFTSENRVMSMHGLEEKFGLNENIRYFDDFLKKARELAALRGMGEARLLHFCGDRFGCLALFFAAEGDDFLQPIAETFSHMVLFMLPESSWEEAETLMRDLLRIIRTELARFSQHLEEDTSSS